MRSLPSVSHQRHFYQYTASRKIIIGTPYVGLRESPVSDAAGRAGPGEVDAGVAEVVPLQQKSPVSSALLKQVQYGMCCCFRK